MSSEPIDYPKVIAPRLQVILTQAAADEFAPDTLPGGRIIYDDFFVTDMPGLNTGGSSGNMESTAGVLTPGSIPCLSCVPLVIRWEGK